MQKLSRGLLAYPRFMRAFSGDAQILDSAYPSQQRSTTHRHFRPHNRYDEKASDSSSHVIVKNLLDKCIKPQENNPELIKSFRQENGVKVFGEDIPSPLFSFSDLLLPKSVSASIAEAGIEKPTPIQSEAIPIALSGRDMVGIAETGSGKTLSFILPGISHITNQYYYKRPIRSHQGPYALILAPTRELAMQITEECKKYIMNINLNYACVYGGAPRYRQQIYLTKGIHFLIATPGRLIDFVNTKDANLDLVSYVVLDEADRMLDMGFEPQIRTILDKMKERQTLMFSATWPREVRNLAADFLTDPIQVQIGSLELTANKNISQIIEFVSGQDKQNCILDFVRKLKEDQKVLIFSETKNFCDKLGEIFLSNNIEVEIMHGDKDQMQRNSSLARFKDNKVNIMIATDVASRGLDVKNIDYVINYDLPKNIDSYIHRIGRTGRAGKKGTAISYFTPDDSDIAKELIRVLKEAGQPVPEELKRHFEYRSTSQRGTNRNSSFRGGNNSRSSSSFSQDDNRSSSSFPQDGNGRPPRFIRDIKYNSTLESRQFYSGAEESEIPSQDSNSERPNRGSSYSNRNSYQSRDRSSYDSSDQD